MDAVSVSESFDKRLIFNRECIFMEPFYHMVDWLTVKEIFYSDVSAGIFFS